MRHTVNAAKRGTLPDNIRRCLARMVLIGKVERKVVAGLALEFAYQESPENISQLLPLWEDPELKAMEEIGKRLLESTEPKARTIGHILQQGLGSPAEEPNPVAWRDLALDMYECLVILGSHACSVGEMADKETDSTKKKSLINSYQAFREWQTETSCAIRFLRDSNWTQAKIEIDEGYLSSTSTILDSFAAFNPNFREAIKHLREDMKKFRETALRYPSKLPFSEDRASIIARLQESLLALCEIGRTHESDLDVLDVVNYPIEKLGTAVRYLVNGVEIEHANYEVGIASDHLKHKIKGTSGSVGRNLKKISDDLEVIFSELPAKPWGIPGFGATGVESRFKSDGE